MFCVLITAFLILFAYLSWRNLLLATAFIVAFLPTYLIRFNVGSIPLTLLEGMILVLFGVWAVKNIITLIKDKEKKFRARIRERFLAPLGMTKWWLVIILLWLVIATVSMFVSPNLRAAAGIWKAYFIEPILFLIVFLNVIKTKKDLELIFYALGFSAIYISLFAIYQKFTGFAIPYPWQEEAVRRVTSFYRFPNAVGLYLAPIVVLYVGLLIRKLRITNYELRITLYHLLVIMLSAAAIIFAESEGAYAGILAGCFFLGIMTKKLRWPTLIFSAIFVLIILLAPQFRNYAWRQISFQEASGKVRTVMWEETIEMLKDRPILGAGLAGYQETFDPYHKARHIEIYLYPHNLFLNFWSELGLFGLITFLLIIGGFFYALRIPPSQSYGETSTHYAFRLRKATARQVRITLYATILSLLVHGLVDAPYFKNDLSILFWLIVGFAILLTSNNFLNKFENKTI